MKRIDGKAMPEVRALLRDAYILEKIKTSLEPYILSGEPSNALAVCLVHSSDFRSVVFGENTTFITAGPADDLIDNLPRTEGWDLVAERLRSNAVHGFFHAIVLAYGDTLVTQVSWSAL